MKITPWRIVGYLSVVVACNYADRAAFSAVLPPLRADLGLSDVTTGLLSSLFLWSYALSSLVAGTFADRYSRSRLIVCSLVLWSLVTLFTGLTTGFIMLCVLRVLLGMTESLYHPAAVALLADHHGPATRGRALGIHSLGLNFGVVVGGSVAGYLAQAYGWRMGFIALGVGGIGLAFFARFFLADRPASAPPATRNPGVGEAVKYLIRVPSYHILLFKSMLAGITVWIFLSWLPLYFSESFHLNLGAAGFAGTFMLQISTMIGIGTGGWVSDVLSRKDPRRRMLVQAVAYFAAAPFLLIFLADPGFTAVAVAVSCFSMLRGLGASSELPALCEVVPSCYRSSAVGVVNACATAAGGMGVFVAGFLKRDFGLNAVFAGSCVVFIIAAISLVIGYRVFMAKDIARARAYERSPDVVPAPAGAH